MSPWDTRQGDTGDPLTSRSLCEELHQNFAKKGGAKSTSEQKEPLALFNITALVHIVKSCRKIFLTSDNALFGDKKPLVHVTAYTRGRRSPINFNFKKPLRRTHQNFANGIQKQEASRPQNNLLRYLI